MSTTNGIVLVAVQNVLFSGVFAEDQSIRASGPVNTFVYFNEGELSLVK